MYLAGTELNLNHRAVEIYISGCRNHCSEKCQNPELWDFTVGQPYNEAISDILQTLETVDRLKLLDFVWLLGGEPLDQPEEELVKLIDDIRKAVSVQIVLWTHYTEVPDNIRQRVNYVKSGPYNSDGEPYTEPLFGVRLANREQKIVEVTV